MMQPQEFPGAIQKNILNIGVFLVCVFIAHKIFVTQMQQVASIQAETEKAQQKNAVLTEIAQSEKRLKNLRRSINNKDETSIINTLNAIAKDCNVKIVEWKPVPPEKVLGYVRYPFALNIALDNYHTLGKFMSALESNPFLFTIENISVNNDEAGHSIYRLHVNLEVSTILID
jgi:Tfp pilus assembly protein PilO